MSDKNKMLMLCGKLFYNQLTVLQMKVIIEQEEEDYEYPDLTNFNQVETKQLQKYQPKHTKVEQQQAQNNTNLDKIQPVVTLEGNHYL